MTKNNIEQLKDDLIHEMLVEFAFSGWGMSTAKKAAKSLNFDAGYDEILFPLGMDEINKYCSAYFDRKMIEAISEYDLENMRIRDKISTAIMVRINLYSQYKEAIRSIMVQRAMPHNLWPSLCDMGNSMSLIWYAIGDKSNDYNYYTKRMTLSAVYSSTLIYWLNDDSDEHENTKNFLAKRIENVMQFEKLKHKFIEKLNSSNG